jgi:hypothetical protein
VSLPDGWQEIPREDIEREWTTDAAGILAMWSDVERGHGCVTIYEDGQVEVDGLFPVELLPFMQLRWIGHQRGKVA